MFKWVPKAIRSYYLGNDASALRALNTGGMFFQQAALNVSEPYIVFYYDGQLPEDFAGGRDNKLDTVTFHFNIYSAEADGGTECSDIADSLIDVFDEASLTISSSASFDFVRFHNTGISDLGYMDNVWQCTVGFNCIHGR